MRNKLHAAYHRLSDWEGRELLRAVPSNLHDSRGQSREYFVLIFTLRTITFKGLGGQPTFRKIIYTCTCTALVSFHLFACFIVTRSRGPCASDTVASSITDTSARRLFPTASVFKLNDQTSMPAVLITGPTFMVYFILLLTQNVSCIMLYMLYSSTCIFTCHWSRCSDVQLGKERCERRV